MKKLLLKSAAAIMVISMGITLFSGCANQENVNTGSEEAIELIWYGFGKRQPEHEVVMEKMNEVLLEKMNAKLRLEIIDSGSYENKMNLTIAANEVYDLCYTSNWLNKYIPNVSKGAFMPLKELIDKEAPNLKKALPETLFEVANYKGDIYAVPNYQIIYSSPGIIVQKKLADKYNLDLNNINNLNDLEPFLEKVRDNEKGIYPLSILGMEVAMTEYEAVPPLSVLIRKSDEKLKVHGQIYMDYTRQQQAFYADYYRKGFMRKDLLTVIDDSSDVVNNRYAVMTGTVKPGGDIEMKKKTGEDYISKSFQEPYISALSGMETMTAISKTSANPQKAIKLVELMNTDTELYNLLVFGIEGRHYTKISDNTVAIPQDSKYTMSTAAWQFGNQFNAFYMEGQKAGIWEETDRLNREAQVSPIRGFTLDIEPIKNEVAQIQAVDKEYDLKRLFARQDWEKAFEEYVEKSKRAGLDKVIKEAQRQIDEFKRNK